MARTTELGKEDPGIISAMGDTWSTILSSESFIPISSSRLWRPFYVTRPGYSILSPDLFIPQALHCALGRLLTIWSGFHPVH